jgi:hypothetical protein
MVAYLVLVSLSGTLCWATVARTLPSFVTLELVLLCCFVGILLWLGVIPLLWFYVFLRSGLVGSLLDPAEITIVPLDVTFVRLLLPGPLSLLAGVILSVAAFAWARTCPSDEPNHTAVPAG